MIIDKEQDFSEVRTLLLQEVFQSPENAFNVYQKAGSFGYFEILRTHFLLWILAPATKIISNLVFSILSFIRYEEGEWNPFSGVVFSFAMYPAVLFLVAQLDVFRIFMKKTDRSKGEALPPANILLVSFIPFSASSVFWILPSPFQAIFISVSFIFSCALSVRSLKKILNWNDKDILIFFLSGSAYFLTGTLFLTIVYNLVRTILN
ncbi:hypothetical protein [Leptospira borgpetersenii]|uniref:Yip1 domain protein n=1 Tax=Leptospira borgpetersenii serovar Javanica str. UI 09931 TaxID=1049767 RepID=A0AAV3JEM1_LEPBO|nr:hypothetical protein [Leptospira borgpetersenii]AXX16955.1 hypothetical protein C4Q31_16810 [Leptospira borgpetersenii serovar Ceylonica]EKQ93955.1 hypothetical protein LEP1GSC101_1879 [Leptospira borgpetersenii str. UI 09149]EMN57320.1 hypothetical protein LEP1GSC090_2469 [Leptospira borgpetersenii serovar Javanica str. MK146]EPG58029.1 hypothetical protein LEP1GSC103_2370 [Leptospira borgpetersenii serovar Javanica str. UI 09931]MDQ7243341.1 hypothetical protein [Leptospira borgpetersenii